jgi:thiol:disulfide interchange protein DsbD
LKGDWTNPDPAITAALHQYGQDGVPLYLLIAPGGQVTVLRQILTPGIVVAALKNRAIESFKFRRERIARL